VAAVVKIAKSAQQVTALELNRKAMDKK